MTKVVVLLKNTHAGVSARSAKRAGLIKAVVSPLASSLRSHGAKSVAAGKALPFVVASVSSAQEAALKQNPAVKAVFPNSAIPMPQLPSQQAGSGLAAAPLGSPTPSTLPADTSTICGTAAHPENDPEALSVINAQGATDLGIDGAGVSVAYIAGSIDTTIQDFQRNAAYASSGSAAGSPVVTNINFTGDTFPTGGGASIESFLDASSIASQGNETFDLSQFVNTNNPLPAGCDIHITGDAPGASVTGIDVFANQHATTESNFIQAIDYAVANGVQVLNESFGANQLPDTANDATRIADDDAIAAGVTVVVSSGDAGITNTLGSPSTDPNVISAGASTTFRAYEQETFGGINATDPNATNGTWLNNNISSLSSGGFSESGGNTVDLVAPGDSNWIDCSTNALFASAGCDNENGQPAGMLQEGGTSESSPLTAGAAADVIQAYQSTHSGSSPSPAEVKQILTSTATDIGAPAEQQGAGLLNIGAAVKLAEAVDGGGGTQGSLDISPNQINVTQNAGHTTKQPVSVTNTGTHTVTVNLSSRTIKNTLGSESDSFCLNPTASTISCGPPTTDTFKIWSGATEVYQEQTFTVPKAHAGRTDRLDFSATYPNTGQSSLLHVALYDPSGAYAGYSLPQGLSGLQDIQVTNPKAGTWTAVFFTLQANSGTKGTINWQATTWGFAPAGTISPSSLVIPAGATKTAMYSATSGGNAGDVAQSILLNSSDGSHNTVPVTVRTRVPIASVSEGGAFKGTLTGGNGRGNPAQGNDYVFTIPSGVKDVDVKTDVGDANNTVVAFLTDPEGNTVANSSNLTANAAFTNFVATGEVDVYKDNPQPGQWTLTLAWLSPTSSDALSQPFTGHVSFNRVRASGTLPAGGQLNNGQVYSFNVTVKNTGGTPQTYFLDPRTTGTDEIQLPSQTSLGCGDDQNMSLPLNASGPCYDVPSNTSEIEAGLDASVPVTFDTGPFSGDPDLYGTGPGNTAAVDYNSGDEVMPGLWFLNPSEIGPYPNTGAPSGTASADFTVVTQSFDSTVDTGTGDMWLANNGLSNTFDPVYLQPGQKATIPVTITPSASSGTHVTGVIDVDDAFQTNTLLNAFEESGDELSSLPFHYVVH